MRATVNSQRSRSETPTQTLTSNIFTSQVGRRQFIVILMVVLIPIALLSVNLYFNQRNNIIDETLEELDDIARIEESIIDLSFENLENSLALTATSRNITIGMDVLTRLPDNESSQELIRQTIDDIGGEGQAFEAVGAYSLDGNLLVSTNSEELPPSGEVLEYPEFIAGQTEPYIGNAFYDDEGEADFIITVPIVEASGDVIGVLLGLANFDRLNNLLRENVVNVIESQDVYLVSQDGFLLTDSFGFEFGEQTEPVTSTGIEAALNGETGTGRYDDYRSINVLGAYRWLPQYGMALVTEAETNVIVPSPTELFIAILPTIALSFILAVVLVVFSVNGLVKPLIIITSTARQFSDGDLEARVPSNTGYGEMKTLGTTFNEMANQVEATVGGLEGQIAARTRDLQAVIDVSTRISTILDVNQLLDDVTDLTKERFALYHAHVYLYNREEDQFILTAGSGYVGEQMVAEKRSINYNNQKSIVALAGRTLKSVSVADVTDSPDFLPHPLLPDTRSEFAIPLVARGQLLGVLDVQSDKILYFEPDIQRTLEVLASQISTALSNAQLYTVSQRTSRHELAMGTISRSIEQATSVDDILQTAVRELGKALRVPHTAIELQMTDPIVEDET